MIGRLKKVKRAVTAWWERVEARRDVRRAFRHDERQFLLHAGALHPGRQAAERAAIVMGYHVLEKGLTMPRRRLGFGQAAAHRLAELVGDYERRFGRGDGQVLHAAGVLRAYRDLHRESESMPWLDAFLAERPEVPAAVEPHVTREAFFAAKDAPFAAFAASRHVVRHFAGVAPREALEKAIGIALAAPSACNRQPVRVHAFGDRAMLDRLFALQGGARGFGQDAGHVLVVTVDLSFVRWAWERHDAYVNGGIFVAYLCLALHHCGLAHCILHWSVAPEADLAAHRLLGIPENEAIVQVVACGVPPEEFDVAASPRVGLDAVAVWHRSGGSAPED